MGLFLETIVQGLLTLLSWAIIASAIMSWLIAFNVINTRHPIVGQIERFLWAVTRPVLWPIQKVVPSFGGVDVSPLIALMIIWAAQRYLIPWVFAPIVAALGG